MANCDAKYRGGFTKEQSARIRRRLLLEALHSKRRKESLKTIQEICLEEIREEELEELISQHKGDK